MQLSQIKKMWSERAASIASSAAVTHWDVHQRRLEVNELAKHLQPTDVVLDMGCGNGWATVQLAPYCKQITGADYSEAMIERARSEQQANPGIGWKVVDVLNFQEENAYDVITTVRCLINVVDTNLQQQAIRNLHRALKPGGRLLMMEGVADGRGELNRVREAVGLGTMPKVVHNLDFPRAQTLTFLRGLFTSAEFTANGVYDLITRVLYPLLIKPQEPAYGSPLHEAALPIIAEVAGLEELSRFGLFKAVK